MLQLVYHRRDIGGWRDGSAIKTTVAHSGDSGPVSSTPSQFIIFHNPRTKRCNILSGIWKFFMYVVHRLHGWKLNWIENIVFKSEVSCIYLIHVIVGTIDVPEM